MVGKFGCNGNKGNSSVTAYQIAVENGFQGSVQEWLKSLQGEKGENGAPGTNGVMGKSAYQIAVDNGFVGDESAWLQSLKGERGEAGMQGPPGEVGPAGMGAAGADGLNGSQIYWVDNVSQLNNLYGSRPIVGHHAPYDYAIVKSTMELYSLKNTGSNYQIELIGSLKGTTDVDFSDLSGTEDIATKQEITDAVSGIKIGGRNLLRNSNKAISNSDYLIAIYSITEMIKEGEEVTITIKGELGDRKTSFAVYNSGGSVELTTLKNKGNGIYQATFNWKIGVSNNKFLNVYTYYSSVVATSSIEWIQLEKGNKATDWSPAPEDFYAEISTIILKTSTNIVTTTLINGYSQNGRTVVTQGTANIVVAVDSADGFASSYQKGGTGSITFQAAAGKTLVQVDGTNVVDGAKGSTATVTVVGNEILLRISNV